MWARPADLPAPIVFGRRDVEAAERAQVRGLLDAHPAVAALRAERAEYHPDLPPEDATVAAAGWSAFLDDTLELAAWDEIGAPRRYVTAQVGSEAEGCDGFGERAALLFLRDGAALVAQPGPGFLDPVAVMDIDRDGALEAVTERGHTLASHREDSPLIRHYAFPDLGCGWGAVILGVSANSSSMRCMPPAARCTSLQTSLKAPAVPRPAWRRGRIG